MNQGSQKPSQWHRLFRIACSIIEQANQELMVIDHWTFGGGTALMLQMGHRESHDVDLFLRDPQYLGYLNPELRDFTLEVAWDEWKTDGHRFCKFVFTDIGEIDFIAAPSLTKSPTIEREVQGVQTLVETVPEIITKKVFYRGGNITPRDVFDMAAASTVCRAEVADALKQHPDSVQAALSRIQRLNPEFVERAVSDLMVKDRFRNIVPSSLRYARELLEAALP